MKKIIFNNKYNNMYNELLQLFSDCDEYYINVAFITFSGVQLIIQKINELNKRGVKGKIIGSTYLNFTDPKALEKLNDFENVEVRIFDTNESNRGFHSKCFIFRKGNRYKVIIGSSNLTASALKENIEWNAMIELDSSDCDDREIINSILDEFNYLYHQAKRYKDFNIDEYQTLFKKNKQKILTTKKVNTNDYEPNAMQKEAINNLALLRSKGERKGLVIAATGSGKTFMSAFDVKAFKAKRVLFVVHRGEILRKAKETFELLFGDTYQYGFLDQDHKDYEATCLFANISTLSKYYNEFSNEYFDYIIIDEAHHVGANNYQMILNYFRPQFLLGMSATPERSDGYDVYEAFDYNVAFELRLKGALSNELVAPFHYFGIYDQTISFEENEKKLSTNDLVNKLNVQSRVDYIIDQMELIGFDGKSRKAIGFCENIEHAKFMSEAFNKRGYHSVYLTGKDNSEVRNQHIIRLQDDEDELEIIFTVDIFNEGVDIPQINQVLMLRPTQSQIIFLQQLGRGLRKHQSKEFVTILDFISNYNRSFLIALALSDKSSSLDKDGIKLDVKNNFSEIPGKSFIQLDEIARDLLIKQLDNNNLNTMTYLKEQYYNVKNSLNHIPLMSEFNLVEGAIDPIRFVLYAGSYYDFLIRVEKDYSLFEQDGYEHKMLKQMSKYLPIKRLEEFMIIKAILNGKYQKNQIVNYLKDNFKVNYSEANVDYAFEFLANLKYSEKQRLTDGRLDIVNPNGDANKLFIEHLKNQEFYKLVADIVDYGINDYYNNFTKRNGSLEKYAYYSPDDILIINNAKRSLNTFREGIIELNNEFYLIVDLKKDENTKKSINYENKITNRYTITWQSQNTNSPDKGRGYDLVHHEKLGKKIHMFVRKIKKVDGITQQFMYLGEVVLSEYHGSKPIDMIFKFKDPLPSEVYNDLIEYVE